jgi:hypothetical protein
MSRTGNPHKIIGSNRPRRAEKLARLKTSGVTEVPINPVNQPKQLLLLRWKLCLVRSDRR